MAVLAGFFSFADPAAAKHFCERSLAAQSSYGASQAEPLTLGSAAFGRIDGGARPSPKPLAGRWLVAADARIDNRPELIARLGSRVASGPCDDGDLMLAAWSAWGPAGLDAVIGDYAVAMFDAVTRELILARDSSGERPLFHARGPHGVAFSSMPSGCRAVGDHPPHLAALAAQLSGHSADEQSLFAGIARVRPGELVRITADGIRRERHWQPRLYHPSSRPARSMSDDVEQYRALLSEAVACRLPRPGEMIASQLSSGWDSNAVTSTAALLRPGEVTAFTAAPTRADVDPLPRGRVADESALAALTTQRHGIDHVVLRGTAPLVDVLRRHAALTQAPALGSFNLAWWEAIRMDAARCGATHLLTGELGNYTLNAGGLPILSHWVQQSMWRHWWREAREAARRPDVRWRGVMVNSFGYALPRSAMRALRRQFLGMPGDQGQAFLAREWREQAALSDAPFPSADPDPYAARLAALRDNDSGMVRKAAFAQSGLKELDPTADRRLVEFSLALPPERLFAGGKARPLARAALADRVPAEILDFPLRGFQAADWYLHLDRGAAREAIEEIEPCAAVRALLDLDGMKRALDHWPEGDWNSERHISTYRFNLTGALAAGLFLARFSDQPS